jgi:hypothetical protein
MYRRNDTPAVVPTSGVKIIETTLSKKWYGRPTKKIEEIDEFGNEIKTRRRDN